MVKLKIIARIIPENAYLTSLESSAAQNSFMPGEKRFHVIVREPDTWFIGTLVNAIKQRYQSLYKNDLGQIKYLKDNQDDCDLDPELSVGDAFVDEGKALRDPSDQQATIRVIQEQGRAVRQGSVVPDLAQLHYSLPERTTRPPIPRFEEATPIVRKRKTELVESNGNHVSKRTRLDEIEEDDVVASIEPNQPLEEEVVIENSQPAEISSSSSKRRHIRPDGSPELSWSFKDVNPSITRQSASSVQETKGTQPHQQPTIQNHQSPNDLSTLNGSSNEAQNGETNDSSCKQKATSAMAASRTSKPVPQSRRDLYTEPDSDIESSRSSPEAHDTSRITPRLVPSGRVKRTNIANRPDGARQLWQKPPEASDHVVDDSTRSLKQLSTSKQSKGDKEDVSETSSVVSSDVRHKVRRRRNKTQLTGTDDQSKMQKVGETVENPKLHTPAPESPSEQLSQALQDSARKTRSTGSASADGTGSRKTSPASVNTPTNRVNQTRSGQTAPPVKDAPVREPSVVSQATSASKVILPKGMTQDQYDSIVRGNAHLNTLSPVELVKKRSTPSLKKTPSVEMSSSSTTNRIGTAPPKPRPDPKSNTTTTPTPRTVQPKTVKPQLISRPAVARPAMPGTLTSARTLQELRAMASSAKTSAASSPAPSTTTTTTTSRLAPTTQNHVAQVNSDRNHPRKDDEDDESDDSDSSSSSIDETTIAKQRTFAALKARPDPTIRDVSDDDD